MTATRKNSAAGKAIQAIEQRTQPLVKQALAHLEAGRHDDTRAVLMGDLRPAFTDWLAAINALIDYEEQKASKSPCWRAPWPASFKP